MPRPLRFVRTACCLAAAFAHYAASTATSSGHANSAAVPPLLYSTPLEEISADTPRIEPWKSIPLDPLYKGMWVVAGDVDGDGEVELVSARIHDVGDVHYTASVVVHKLDGSVLWRWGQPEQGVFPLHSDVACQIYDWDGDGKNEVIVAAERAVVEIDGATGIEKRCFAIPQDASDCIVFCNLTGGPRSTDILVKTRYGQIWAYDRAGKQLWTYKTPGAYRTAHQPRPIDIDGDGRDEIVAGFLMLNPDGSERWAFHEGDPSLAGWKPLVEGHLDCARLLSRGTTPADSTIALTFCGAERIALVRGTGDVIWSVYGKHFESIDLGKVCRGVDGRQLVAEFPMRRGVTSRCGSSTSADVCSARSLPTTAAFTGSSIGTARGSSRLSSARHPRSTMARPGGGWPSSTCRAAASKLDRRRKFRTFARRAT